MPRHYNIGLLRIPEPPEINAIRAALKNYYSSARVDFGFSASATARGGARFVVAGGTELGFAEVEYPLLPFLGTTYLNFWLGLEAQFQTERHTTAFKSVSLLIFAGELASNTRPVLRAEWEAIEGLVHHAQPHWHVYGSAVIGHVDYIGGLLREIEDDSIPSLESARMHLAMMARWNSTTTPPEDIYTEPSAAALQVWVTECLRYVAKQLQYVCTLHGSR